MGPSKPEQSPSKDVQSIVLSSGLASDVTAIQLPSFAAGGEQEAEIEELIAILAPLADEGLILALEGELYEEGFPDPMISKITNGLRARAAFLNVL